MGIRQTHAYVTMAISRAAYKEIYDKMEAAGYEHAINDEGEIDMHGIAVVPDRELFPGEDDGS
jgi:hypothetical protein